MTDHPRRECQCPRARHKHGTVAAYTRDKCRCLPCRMAKHYALGAYAAGGTWREADDAYTTKIGTVRRLQALMAIGYTSRLVALHTGLSEHHVQNLRNAGHEHVSVRIALAVARTYDELWDKPATDAQASRQRTKARRLGFLPPMAWDDDTIDDPNVLDNAPVLTSPTSCTPTESLDTIDEIAVEEAMTGRRVTLNRAETSEAIARLTRMGIGAEEIGQRLGMSSRNVVRFRSRGESVAA